MNIQYVKYALEVEKTGSISHAAQNLYMGQPNLSKAIKELETSLGITLFRRTSKGVVPTEKGKEFFTYAKRIMQITRSNRCTFRSPTDQAFRVSVPRCSYIANAFTSFVAALDMDSEMDVTIRETNTLRTIRNVTEDNYDLGIIRYQSSNEQYFSDYLKKRNLKSQEILEFVYSVLLSSSHPLAVRETLSPEMLDPYIEIMHGDLSIPFLPEKEEEPTRSKKRIYVFERGSQFDILTRISNSYMWVSPCPRTCCTAITSHSKSAGIP
jgi:DNA-binding transcriptional LysR family regulator